MPNPLFSRRPSGKMTRKNGKPVRATGPNTDCCCAKPCSFNPVSAGNDDPFDESYPLEIFSESITSRRLCIQYATYWVKDRIVVSSLAQGVIHDSGCVGTSELPNGGPAQFPFTVTAADSPLRVQVYPNCEGDTGTVWDFAIRCYDCCAINEADGSSRCYECESEQPCGNCKCKTPSKYKIQMINPYEPDDCIVFEGGGSAKAKPGGAPSQICVIKASECGWQGMAELDLFDVFTSDDCTGSPIECVQTLHATATKTADALNLRIWGNVCGHNIEFFVGGIDHPDCCPTFDKYFGNELSGWGPTVAAVWDRVYVLPCAACDEEVESDSSGGESDGESDGRSEGESDGQSDGHSGGNTSESVESSGNESSSGDEQTSGGGGGSETGGDFIEARNCSDDALSGYFYPWAGVTDGTAWAAGGKCVYADLSVDPTDSPGSLVNGDDQFFDCLSCEPCPTYSDWETNDRPDLPSSVTVTHSGGWSDGCVGYANYEGTMIVPLDLASIDYEYGEFFHNADYWVDPLPPHDHNYVFNGPDPRYTRVEIKWIAATSTDTCHWEIYLIGSGPVDSDLIWAGRLDGTNPLGTYTEFHNSEEGFEGCTVSVTSVTVS